SGHQFKTPVAAVTFDDGYSDVYHHAYPLLKRKGIPATFFVVTGLIDSNRPQIFDRLYLLLRLVQRKGLPLHPTIISALNAAVVDTARLAQFRVAAGDPFSIMTAVLNGFSEKHIEMAITVLEQQVSSNRAVFKEMMPLTSGMIETMNHGGMAIGSHTHS